MGFTLFTQSGTFNPADYGLKVGDMIHILAVGGGGGGGGSSTSNDNGGSMTVGANGSASSFGSIITAAGGSGGASTPGISGSPGASGNVPSFKNNWGPYVTLTSSSGAYIAIGGPGAHGWNPGYDIKASFNSIASEITNGAISDNMKNIYVRDGLIYSMVYSNTSDTASFRVRGAYTAQTNPRGGYGSIYVYTSNGSNPARAAAGPGGIGYGAGGGGAVYGYYPGYWCITGSGGNAGVQSHMDYKLTSLNTISVTVGAGGKGGGTTNVEGGGGASGCVALWW